MPFKSFFIYGRKEHMENQLSNECLCKLIQEGHTEYLFQLWLQCEKFIRMIAEQYVTQFDRGQELSEDCVQEAYLALHGIALRFRPDHGVKFLTFLKPSLHSAFRSVMFSGRGAAEKDPLNNCDSIDRMITDGEGNSVSLVTMLEDVHSQDGFEKIEADDYRKSQNAFIRECIQLSGEEIGKSILTEMLESNCGYRDAIVKLYGPDALDNEAFILQLRKKKDKAVSQIREKTRRGKKAALMRKYSLEQRANRNGLKGYSLTSFRNHGFTSEVERIVLK